MTKQRKNKVAVPVQCTILVPLDIDLDFDAEEKVDSVDSGCGFVSLDSLPDGDSLALKLVQGAIDSEDVKTALNAFALAASSYKELYPDHNIKLTPYAGLVPESDI